MSRDIRSYFQTAKKTSSVTSSKNKKRRLISSDEDDEKSKSPIKPSKKTKTLKKSAIESDSDTEARVVSPGDIFGKKPISREEAPKISKQLQKEEAKAHNDDDFEATLCQLDTSDIERKYVKESESNTNNENTKKTLVKDKENIKKKKTPEKNKKQSKPKTKKHSSNSSNEDIKHTVPESSNKSKHTKRPKSTSPISKMEVEHIEKKVSPKKKEVHDVYEERVEKRKQHAQMYQQYLQRGGARNPGSKEIPVGAEYCLAGLSFVITGVLDSLEREEAEELIKKYGGRILHQPSRKTDYVIIGDQPGASKLAKINSLNIEKISEDELLEMIRTRPAGQANNVIHPSHRASSKNKTKRKSAESEDMSPSPSKEAKGKTEEVGKSVCSPQKEKSTEKDVQKLLEKSPHKKEHHTKHVKTPSPIKKQPREDKSVIQDKKETSYIKDIQVKEDISHINGNVSQALVEKYRPKSMKQILGQQGDKSNAKKLHNWLLNWHKNQSGQVKHAKPSPWAKNDDGAFFKAALLSGPPGIGKTTTAQVVCNELGFDLVEFNASDTRSKKLLKEEVSDLLSNTTLKDYFTDSKSKPNSNHVLLMDEVDGMAGNEDRGGLQELINLIKSTDIPIICICNDRNNPKMRTLSNYTYDLRFSKPRLEQIRGAMKTICFKEHINISTEDLDRLIESTNQDIRQVINHLALFVDKTASQEKSQKKHINKDLKLGPWDVVRMVFSADEHKHMNIHDKSDLFFHDYSIAPLFVQENYLLVTPQVSKNKVLERVAECAESLAIGDIVDKSIRSNNAWSLLPVQACFSSVIPGTVMSGRISGQINFPAWLGRNSKAGKFNRLMQEITVHMRLTTGASKEAINLDYVKPLRNAIVRPLATADVDTSINVMNHYHLLREDLDSLIEISLWPGDRDPMQVIDSKIKTAFTKAYNKNCVAVPYIVSGTSKKKAASNLQDEGSLEAEEEEAEGENSDEGDDSVETDKMIKAKKPVASKKTESKDKSTNSKPSKRGRGRGKGK
nr:PREDICTED: replication factor C subunit 1 isoform X2 [Megachile rotundata]